ncbi:hypothetical protein [Lentilitoribacter sp. Alg239-R112]|uniref:hypothetical protein n=1 Tax=Lentilitoribacter sp. Alg239-R112 TaxID=2305987 RepID=UPI0013A6D5FD|nr:hypothetical protein [Lentilitoribacter sp. Alg239-R112]
MSYKKVDVLDWPDTSIIGEVFHEIRKVSSLDIEFPFSVQLLENPKYSVLGRNLLIFPGAVDGTLHDYIHILLGRSFLPLDEAVVVGCCMGSTGKMSKIQTDLFTFLASTIYPTFYRFTSSEKKLFEWAVSLGSTYCKCDLSKIEKSKLAKMTISEARDYCLSDWQQVLKFYKAEARRFPDEISSARLLNYIQS